MPNTKTPKIRIPAAYRKHRELVAIPKEEYEQLKLAKHARVTTEPRVFKKRPLATVQRELAAAHPNDPQLVADVIAGLKKHTKQTQAARLAAWRKVRGMLKGRLDPDPVEWQRRIRREWDRELPTR